MGKLEKLWTAQELAEETGLSKSTFAIWRHKGLGPRFIKHGNVVRYPDSEVQKFFFSELYQSTAEAMDKSA